MSEAKYSAEEIEAARQKAIAELTDEQRQHLERLKTKVIMAMHRKTVELLAYSSDQVFMMNGDFDLVVHNIEELLKTIDELY